MPNTRKQVFEIVIETRLKDGCGNPVNGLTAGDIRQMLSKGRTVESVCVTEKGEKEEWK